MLRILSLQILRDLLGRHRAVADKMRGIAFLHFADNRPGNFPRDLVKLFLDGISAIVSGAALDCLDLGVRRQRQKITSVQADILHA